jgi:hypothetical protein
MVGARWLGRWLPPVNLRRRLSSRQKITLRHPAVIGRVSWLSFAPKPYRLRVPQVLLASDPLWAALFAGLISSSERDLGAAGWAGGALIVSGAMVAGVGSAAELKRTSSDT